MNEDDKNSARNVAKAMRSVQGDLKTREDVLLFSLNMTSTLLRFLRVTMDDKAVSEFLLGELEELKTPLTPDDYPPGHPKGRKQ